jgi:type I site-specific restriction endonuclease
MLPALKMNSTKYTNLELFNILLDSFPETFEITPDQDKYLVKPVINVLEDYLKNPNEKESKIHIIESFTGSGKTTVLTKGLVHKFPKFFNAILISAPTTQLVDDLKKSIDNQVFQVIHLNADNIKSYYTKKSYRKFPIFVVTQQYFCLENNRGWFEKLSETIYNINPDKLGLGIFVDEVHKGAGNSSKENTLWNYGYPGYDWTGAIFKTLNSLMKHKGTIFGYTATPTNEQQMRGSNSSFILLSKFARSKAKSPFIKAWNKDVKPSDQKIIDASDASLYVNNILSCTLKRFKERSEYRRVLQISQPKLIVKLPKKDPRGWSHLLPIDTVREELNAYARSIGWDDVIIASYRSEEAFIGDDFINKDEFVSEINSIKDRPIIILVVDGLTVGTDIPEICSVVSYGIPCQNTPDGINRTEYVTMGIEQFVGRGMRTGLPDAKDYLRKLVELGVSDTQAYQVIDMITEYLTTDVYLTPARIHNQVAQKIMSETFTPEGGNKWLKLSYDKQKQDYVILNQSNVIGHGRHRIKQVYDQTSTLKAFKKDYCEYHDDDCFTLAFKSHNRNNPDNIMSEIEYRTSNYWNTQLQVDHKDGNRYNNDPSNFMTICANGHAEKTLRNGDCFNNYTGENE